MLATRTVWDELVKRIRDLDVFQDVRAYPLHRVNDAAFLKEFPGLKLPACLVVRLGAQDTAKGQALERVTNWSFVIVARDAAGEAWHAAADLEDAAKSTLDDTMLPDERGEDQVEIMGGNEVSIAFANPRFAVNEIAVTTRELGVRT